MIGGKLKREFLEVLPGKHPSKSFQTLALGP